MNGICDHSGVCFKRSQKANPSISGILVSEMMRSGAAVSTLASASTPLVAMVTLKPAFLSETSRTRRDLVSPSTRRRLCLAKGPHQREAKVYFRLDGRSRRLLEGELLFERLTGRQLELDHLVDVGAGVEEGQRVVSRRDG